MCAQLAPPRIESVERIGDFSVDTLETKYGLVRFEVYTSENVCDREKVVVKNVYEDDRIEAVIPTVEVYELMRDCRDFQREYYVR